MNDNVQFQRYHKYGYKCTYHTILHYIICQIIYSFASLYTVIIFIYFLILLLHVNHMKGKGAQLYDMYVVTR